MTVTKSEIAETIRNDIGYTKADSNYLVECLLEIVKKTLEEGEDVLVSGFGKFQVKHKMARRGRNPATGGDLLLDRRRVVTFKCSGKLRDKLNGAE